MTFGINGAELIILILLAVLILGPEKLPEYTRKLTEWIRNLRRMAEGAKTQFQEETGTDFDEIDWKKYDPRQYDPRRIIKDALADPVEGNGADAMSAGSGSTAGSRASTTTTDRGLRGELDAARAQRDELRDDLKDMDPRSLFFGKSGTKRSSGEEAGGGPPPTGEDDKDDTGGVGGEQTVVAEGHEGADGDTSLPAPFDVDAT